MKPTGIPLMALIGTLAIGVSACSSSAETPESGIHPADTETAATEIAPIFSVQTATGDEFSLSEHLAVDGRPVFLNLWASWCFPCREEMPAIDEASRDHTDIFFIGVSVQDAVPDAKDFANEIAVSYSIGFDEHDSVDDAYSPLGLPASYIISADGVILERIFGRVTEETLSEKFASHFSS